MIRATELSGKAVVDVDAAEKLGRIDRVVLDPDARRVAGFIVSKGSSLLGSSEHITLPATSVHAIGRDAITVHRHTGDTLADARLDGLPRVSDMVGRKVVSDQGRLLGAVDDVLIDETDGRIIGYALTGADLDDKLKNLLSKNRDQQKRAPFLRADADLRAGRDLIVAPEDAVSDESEAVAAADERMSTSAPARNWSSPLLTAPVLTTPVADRQPNSWTQTRTVDSRYDPVDREH